MSLGALSERMGMRLVEARPGRVVATMPVEGNTQPYGLLNGGASAVLAETLGSIAGALHAGPGTHRRRASTSTAPTTAAPGRAS